MPRLYSIDAPYANAFATGRNPENGVVAVTRHRRPARRARLRGVLAHEISHIKNRDPGRDDRRGARRRVSHLAQVLSFSVLFGGASPTTTKARRDQPIALLVAPSSRR